MAKIPLPIPRCPADEEVAAVPGWPELPARCHGSHVPHAPGTSPALPVPAPGWERSLLPLPCRLCRLGEPAGRTGLLEEGEEGREAGSLPTPQLLSVLGRAGLGSSHSRWLPSTSGTASSRSWAQPRRLQGFCRASAGLLQGFCRALWFSAHP